MASWVVLTLVVGYDFAFLGEEGVASAFNGGGAPGGLRTMSPRPSGLLLFQLSACTTLQFRRLRVAVTIALLFLEHAPHSTLPPVAVAAIAHAFKEYCGGGGEGGAWGGSANFGTSSPSTW